MGTFLDELVIPMPPLPTRVIEAFGEKVLEVIDPEMLKRPKALDLISAIAPMGPLETYGIQVFPVSQEELGPDRLAATDPETNYVLLLDEEYDNLDAGGNRANRPRATLSHEISHAILHTPVIRRMLKHSRSDLLMNRRRRDQIPAFRDPEWQAWALAGAIMMPRVTLETIEDLSSESVADAYGASPSFAQNHLKRIKMGG